ncbi:hypothetical protein MBLNU459_g1241t1 [Dothideomycetes sp. NU459]
MPTTTSNETESLGLPDNWVIYPLLKTDISIQAERRAAASLDGNGSEESYDGARPRHSSQSRSGLMELDRIDISKPLVFSVIPQHVRLPQGFVSRPPSISSTLSEKGEPPSYRSRSSSVERDVKPPPYEDHPLHSSTRRPKTSAKDPLASISENKPDFLLDEKPKPKLARPLPRDNFTEIEIEELRRKTRHHIRVVTRNSIGLTVTLALSGVAPQLLIAAAINVYCLGRGAYLLHQHLDYLRWNHIQVRKRDIIIAITEGAAVKLVFIAITVNHDDFVVFTREALGSHAPAVFDDVEHNPLPGFHDLNEWFIRPTEAVQKHLGLATMAEQAQTGTAFGTGSWHDAGTQILKNMFFVGAVQGGMEQLVDTIQDRLCKATGSMARMVKPRSGPAPWASIGRDKGLRLGGRSRRLKRSKSGEVERNASPPGRRARARARARSASPDHRVRRSASTAVKEKYKGAGRVAEKIVIYGAVGDKADPKVVVDEVAVDKAVDKIMAAGKKGHRS